jgi:hypothetical protein
LGSSAFRYVRIWKFGDYKHFTLKLLTKVLGASPKDDIDAVKSLKFFYKDKDIDELLPIVKDVIVVAQIILKLRLSKIING